MDKGKYAGKKKSRLVKLKPGETMFGGGSGTVIIQGLKKKPENEEKSHVHKQQ